MIPYPSTVSGVSCCTKVWAETWDWPTVKSCTVSFGVARVFCIIGYGWALYVKPKIIFY